MFDVIGYHTITFVKLYKESLKYYDDSLQKILNTLMKRRDIYSHHIKTAIFDDKFIKKYRVDSPAFSIGFNIIEPIGSIFIYKNFLKLPRNWVKYLLAHEAAHIVLNHYPVNIMLLAGLRYIPIELRFILSIIKTAAYLTLGDNIKFPEEGVTAEKELDADEWAVKTLGNKKPALEFLNWIRDKGIKISHISPISMLPALSIDERIERIRKIKI